MEAMFKVGEKGFFNFISPFDKYNQQDELTVLAIRNINDFINNNENIVNLAYLKNGLNVDKFQYDQINNENIVTFEDSFGSLLLVPIKYVASLAIKNSIEYRQHVLMVNLGALPNNSNLQVVTNSVDQLVKELLGLTPIIDVATTGVSAYLTTLDHEDIQSKRSVLKNSLYKGEVCFINCEEENRILRNKIQMLETFISKNKDKLLSPDPLPPEPPPDIPEPPIYENTIDLIDVITKCCPYEEKEFDAEEWMFINYNLDQPVV